MTKGRNRWDKTQFNCEDGHSLYVDRKDKTNYLCQDCNERYVLRGNMRHPNKRTVKNMLPDI